MQVERLENEIVIRIPVDLDSKKLQNVLNLIRYGELTAKSEATQKQVDQMSSEINQSWWAKNRDTRCGIFIPLVANLYDSQSSR